MDHCLCIRGVGVTSAVRWRSLPRTSLASKLRTFVVCSRTNTHTYQPKPAATSHARKKTPACTYTRKARQPHYSEYHIPPPYKQVEGLDARLQDKGQGSAVQYNSSTHAPRTRSPNTGKGGGILYTFMHPSLISSSRQRIRPCEDMAPGFLAVTDNSTSLGCAEPLAWRGLGGTSARGPAHRDRRRRPRTTDKQKSKK